MSGIFKKLLTFSVVEDERCLLKKDVLYVLMYSMNFMRVSLFQKNILTLLIT